MSRHIRFVGRAILIGGLLLLSLFSTVYGFELGHHQLGTSRSTLPPAIYYGWITPTAFLPVTTGMILTAEISGTVCGSTPIQSAGGSITYLINVASESASTPNGCGVSGNIVSFRLDNRIISETATWDNTGLTQVDLTQPLLQPVAVTTIHTTTELDWPTHPAVCNYEAFQNSMPYFTPAAGDSIGVVTAGPVIHMISDIAQSAYFAVSTSDCNGDARQLDRVGRFPFALTPGN